MTTLPARAAARSGVRRLLRPSVLFFLGLFLLYTAVSQEGRAGYEFENYMTAESIVERGSMQFVWPTAKTPKPVYPRHGILQPLLEAPLYWTAREIGFTSSSILDTRTTLRSRGFAVSLFLPLCAALTAVILLDLGKRLFSRRAAWLVALMAAAGSMLFPYAALGMETFFTLTLVASVYFLYRVKESGGYLSALLAGVALGAVLNTKTYAGFFCVALGLYALYALWVQNGRFLRGYLATGLAMLVGFLPFCLLYFWFNMTHSGHWFDLPPASIHVTMSMPLRDWYGYLFAPGKSLFLYSPPLLLLFSAALPMWRRHRAEALLIAGLAVSLLIVMAGTWAAFADEVWGPRYWTPFIPLLVLCCGPAIEKLLATFGGKLILTVVFVAGLYVQILGVTFQYPIPINLAQKAGAANVDELYFIPQYSSLYVNSLNLVSGLRRTFGLPSLVYRNPVLRGVPGTGATPAYGPEVKLGSGHDRIGLLLFHWPGRLGRWPLSSDRFLVLLYGLLFCAPLAAFLAVLRQRDHPDAVQPRDNATPRAAEGLRSVITGITTRFDAMSTRQAQPPALQQDDEHAAPEPAQHHQRWIRPVLAMSLLLLLVVALYLQSNIGSADNGDFGRVMTIVTPGPVGFSVNWPATGTEEYKKRFFAYWLPYWKLDFSVASTMRSSVQLLWLPGALLNYAFVSPAILYLSNIGLLPKLLLIMFLFLALKWIDQGGMTRSRQALLYLTLGTPLLLIFSNTNYVADMNSFYQEPASFVFLLAFLASLLVLWRRRAPWSYALSLVCLMLLATAKPGNVYWPIIGVAFMVEWRKLFSSRAWRVLLVFACTLGMVLLAFIITRYPPQYRRCTAYNRLFYGVLTFSSDPARRMAELGIADGMRCIEGPIFNAIGEQCAQEYGSKMTFLNTALVVLREPAIFGRITADLANHMQDTNVSFVGRVASGDPGAARTGLLNAWSALKLRLFPRGWLFFVVLGGYVLLFARTLRASGMLREFALIGLLTTLAVIIDMYVAMFGDGIATLVRHLYLTNILFDIATIAALNIVVLHAPTMVDALRSMRLRLLA